MRLRMASGGSDAENKESDIPLDVLVLSCELADVLGRSRFPWLPDPLPSLLYVVVNPYLKIGLLVSGEQ